MKKYVVALTGVALYGFLLIHTLGNLQIFLGSAAINAYASLLKASPEILWGFRAGLLVMVLAHGLCAALLAIENRRARPAAYERIPKFGSTVASRTMLGTGSVILIFVAYHIFHFTVRATHPDISFFHDSHGRHDVYSMVVLSFKQPALSLFYIVGVACVCFHLSHGVSSAFYSLGMVFAGYERLISRFALAVSVFIFCGMSSVPIAVMFGILKLVPS